MLTQGKVYRAENAYKPVIESIRAIEMLLTGMPPLSVETKKYKGHLSDLYDLKRLLEERMVH